MDLEDYIPGKPPLPSPEHPEYHASWAAVYERVCSAFPGYAEGSDRLQDLLLRLLPKGRVLDLGCGVGRYAIPLARNGRSVVAVDCSPTMLGQLESSIGQGNLPIEPHKHLIESFMLEPDARCDAAICVRGTLNFIQFSEHLFNMFKNVWECLRPGGLFVLDHGDGENLIGGNPAAEVEGGHLYALRQHREFDDEYESLRQPPVPLRVSEAACGRDQPNGEQLFGFAEETVRCLWETDHVRELLAKAGFEPHNLTGAERGCFDETYNDAFGFSGIVVKKPSK